MYVIIFALNVENERYFEATGSTSDFATNIYSEARWSKSKLLTAIERS